MRAQRALGLLLGATAAGVAACQAIIGIHDETAVPSGDAGAATPDAGDAAPVSTCFPKRPPSQPTVDERGTSATRIFVIKTVSIRPKGETIGYDLDGLCTGDAVDKPCVGSPPDQPNGVDNAFSDLFVSQLPLAPGQGDDPAAKNIVDDIARGHQTALVQVTWNGLANDLHPAVYVTTTPGIGSAASDCAADGVYPFRICDKWVASGLTDGFLTTATATVAKSAWVHDGVLVASFPFVGFSFGSFRMAAHEATLTATVAEGSLSSGLITGRVLATDAVRAAANFHYDSTGQDREDAGPICRQSGGAAVSFVKGWLCPARDLPSEPASPSAICDSISVAVGFDAVAVKAQEGVVDGGVDECADFDASCSAP